MTDEELFKAIRERLFTAVIGDVMDARGFDRQFLPPGIRALRPEMVVVGRAMPVLEADCAGEDVGHSGRPEPFGLMFRALDDLKPGEVYICTGGSPRYALWGGLMSTRARLLGATGAVVDGFHRDTREILGLGFPVFSAGSYAQDQRLRGRVVDFRCAIEFGKRRAGTSGRYRGRRRRRRSRHSGGGRRRHRPGGFGEGRSGRGRAPDDRGVRDDAGHLREDGHHVRDSGASAGRRRSDCAVLRTVLNSLQKPRKWPRNGSGRD
jgi:regulator of RNase E activity RraA